MASEESDASRWSEFMHLKKEETYSTVGFLPWIVLPQTVSVGKIQFIPFQDSNRHTAALLAEAKKPLERILLGYVDVKGHPIKNCTIVCDETRTPIWNLGDNDHAEVQAAVALLTLAGIAKNDFFRSLGSYVNATAFQFYLQRFTGPAEWMTLTVRRRDGQVLDAGYKHGEIKFSVPVQCKSFWKVDIDLDLLAACVQALQHGSAAMRRVKEAISFFNLANTDSTPISLETEVILVAAAFETLLGSKSNAAAVANDLAMLFQPYGKVTVDKALETRPDIKVNVRSSMMERSWFVHKKWIEELYELRGRYVHGNDTSVSKWGWHPLEHLVMAAYVFPLTVKLCLVADQHYVLSDDDVIACLAADHLLAATQWSQMAEGASSSEQTNWQDILHRSRMSFVLDKAWREFDSQKNVE